MRNSHRRSIAAMTDTLSPNVVELYELAEREAVNVYWYTFDDPLMESLVVEIPGGHHAIALDPLKFKSLGDEKYKLAHELGHSLTGSLYLRSTPLDERGRSEQRADRWAIHTLLPFEALRDALSRGITDRQELAEYFDLPLTLINKAIDHYTGPEGRCFDPDSLP